MIMTQAKDLTMEPPRSPRLRIGGYAVLARMADKGRAGIAGTAGEYHFDCPLDNMLFSFKGVTGAEVKPLLEAGKSDEEIARWFDTHGTPQTVEDVKAWSDRKEAERPYDSDEHREWFIGVCEPLGIDPKTATLFDYLEADDHATFAK